MSLKPQDVLLTLKLTTLPSRQILKTENDTSPLVFKTNDESSWSFSEIGNSLGLSKGEAHGSFRRALAAGFISIEKNDATVDRKRFLEFLIYGLASAFYPVRGGVGRGLPTAFWASPLDKRRRPTASTIPLVWAVPEKPGLLTGETLAPLYPTVPAIAERSVRMYQLLVLVDAVRVSSGKDLEVAVGILGKELGEGG